MQDLETWGNKGKHGMISPWSFQIITNEGSDAQENAVFQPSKKIFDKSNSHGK